MSGLIRSGWRIRPPRQATARARTAAERALQAIPGEWLYARVDGVERNGMFLVMELEVIEPSLFFAAAPLAPRLLAEAIVERYMGQVAG